MSNPHPHVHADHHLTAEERIQWSKVVGVAVGALLSFALSIGFAVAILHSVQREEAAQSGKAAEVKSVPEEVGIVNQRLFIQDPRAALTRDAQLQYLHSYGWVDRKAKTIHIPIDQAMTKLIAQQGAGPQK